MMDNNLSKNDDGNNLDDNNNLDALKNDTVEDVSIDLPKKEIIEANDINDKSEDLDELKGFVEEDLFLDKFKIKNYRITKTLGTGSSSSVKQGVHIETGEKVAIKIIKRDTKNPNTKEFRIYREALISSLLCHPNIVRLKSFYYNKNFFFLIFEYISGSMLLNLVLDEGPFSEEVARRYFRQILSAIGYIHENSIVHRDLKIENILIDQNGNVKIVDFGLSNFYDNRRFLKTCCGSLYFAAPELLNGKKYLGPEIDIWSAGVILYVLLCGSVPFDDKNINNLHSKIKEAKLVFTKKISKESKNLLKGMLCKELEKRMGFEDVKNHVWVNLDYKTKIDTYIEKKQNLKKADKRLVDTLQIITDKQFPTLKKDIYQFFESSKEDENNYKRQEFLKKPAISLYFLLADNFALCEKNIEEKTNEILNEKEVSLNKKSEENMHHFVNFIFSKDKENIFSKYFTGSIFENEDTKKEEKDLGLREEFDLLNDKKIEIVQEEIPKIKKSVVKGFYGGISTKNLKCQAKLRDLILQFLLLKNITYEILERHYACKLKYEENYCDFKLSLYRNLIMGSYYLSLKRTAGCAIIFKTIRKDLQEFVANQSKKITN